MGKFFDEVPRGAIFRRAVRVFAHCLDERGEGHSTRVSHMPEVPDPKQIPYFMDLQQTEYAAVFYVAF